MLVPSGEKNEPPPDEPPVEITFGPGDAALSGGSVTALEALAELFENGFDEAQFGTGQPENRSEENVGEADSPDAAEGRFVLDYPVEPPPVYDYHQPFERIPPPTPRAHRVLEFLLFGEGKYRVEADVVQGAQLPDGSAAYNELLQERDFAAATRWFRLAAEQGYHVANCDVTDSNAVGPRAPPNNANLPSYVVGVIAP